MPLSPARLTLGAHVPSSSEHASAGTTEIKDAITRGNSEAVREKLGKTAFSAATLQDLLKHALDSNSSPAIKEALLEHRNCNPESALDLAVQYNDTQLAKQALQRGADPEKIPVNSRPTNDMRALLTYARRLNKLYPPGASLDTETDLDRTLRNGCLDDKAKAEATSLLHQKIADMTIPEAWQHAVKHKQLDMQRAILLLSADMSRDFRSLQDAPVTDKGVAEVMKEIPYFSPKRKWQNHFNGMATFPGTGMPIDCRNFVEHRQEVQQQHPQGKFDDTQFASLEAIANHVSYTTKAKHDHLRNHATEVHLRHNDDFGLALAQQLTSLAAEGKLPQSKFILLASTDHAMSVRLTVKEEENDDKPRYVAEFFDPNFTTSHVRVASASLRTFETLTLKNFIALPEAYQAYYPTDENFSTMFVRPSPQTEQAGIETTQGVAENRMLTSSIKEEDINAAAIHHILANGFSADLRLLKNKVKITKELLAAKIADGYPGLYLALQNGHTDAIRAFGELLEQLPLEERAELLAAKRADGVSGLWVAFRKGNFETIKAYSELLKKIPLEKRSELVAAKDADGNPVLCMLLQTGDADAIEAFGELLKQVPPEERAELLAAKRTNGDPGIFMALQDSHVDAIRAFGELLKLVPSEDERAELVAAKRPNGTSGLLGVLWGENIDAIKAFGELLPLMPSKKRVELLSATFHGKTIFSMLLEEGKLEALKQYIEIVTGIVPTLIPRERANLLMSIRESHAVKKFGMWSDLPYFKNWKKQHPELYLQFQEMKKALKASSFKVAAFP